MGLVCKLEGAFDLSHFGTHRLACLAKDAETGYMVLTTRTRVIVKDSVTGL